jgi:hypothetical protein
MNANFKGAKNFEFLEVCFNPEATPPSLIVLFLLKRNNLFICSQDTLEVWRQQAEKNKMPAALAEITRAMQELEKARQEVATGAKKIESFPPWQEKYPCESSAMLFSDLTGTFVRTLPGILPVRTERVAKRDNGGPFRVSLQARARQHRIS